jgi:hypothetical protein
MTMFSAFDSISTVINKKSKTILFIKCFRELSLGVHLCRERDEREEKREERKRFDPINHRLTLSAAIEAT